MGVVREESIEGRIINPDGSTATTYRVRYLYDAAGRMISSIRDTFDPATGSMLNNATTLYAYYDGTGIIKEKDVTYTDYADPSKSYRKIYRYDRNGVPIETWTSKQDAQTVDKDLIGHMSVQEQIAQQKASVPEGVTVVPQSTNKEQGLKKMEASS